MDDLRDYTEDEVYPEMLSPNRSIQTLPTCTQQKTSAHDRQNERVTMIILHF